MRLLNFSLSRALALAGLISMTGGSALAAVNKPFGQHGFKYSSGTIYPTGLPSASGDSVTAGFYDGWKAQHLRQACGGYYVGWDQAGQPNDLTVSEAMGYGMLAVVLMAGHDPQAQAEFNGLIHFARAFPASINPALMGWVVANNCQVDMNLGGNWSATDGDLDIALALLMANRQWGSSGSVNYLQLARATITALSVNCVRPSYDFMLMSAGINAGSGVKWGTTRVSDIMPNHFRAFNAATGDATWSQVLNQTYALLTAGDTQYAANTGLFPDFLVSIDQMPVPAQPYQIEGSGDGAYSWNSLRDPWRIGTDVLVTGDGRGRAILTKMMSFFRSNSGNNANQIWAGYNITTGSVLPGAQWNSKAFQAPIAVAAMTGSANQQLLNSLWSSMVSAGPNHDYFSDSIELLSMIVVSGNWWAP